MKTVLVYGLAGAEPEKETIVILNSLKKLGYKSILFTDKDCSSSKFADRFVANKNWSYDLLKDVAIEENISLSILIVDFASPLIGRLNRELKLPGPTDIQYNQISDKVNWSQLAQKNNIKMPHEKLILRKEDFCNWDYSGPIIVKPTKSTGNVSPEKFGYSYYESLLDFKKFLEENRLLEHFLKCNQKGSMVGRYLIQEKLDYKFWGNLGFIFVNNKMFFCELHDRYFHPYPYQTHQYASIGPIKLSGNLLEHATKVGHVLKNEVHLNNTGINIDLIETPSGEVYSIDINVRFGSTWSIFHPLRNMNFYESAIEGFLGNNFTMPKFNGSFLRHKIGFSPGKIRNITWPENIENKFRIDGKENCQSGVVIPEITGRHNWPVEMFVTENSHEQCWDTFQKVFKSIDVEYDEA